MHDFIPLHLTVKDVSTSFIHRVPKFLEDLEKNQNLVLLVCKDKTNEEFLSKINPTDSFFYFYKDKYMSLCADYKTTFSSEELLETARLFFN